MNLRLLFTLSLTLAIPASYAMDNNNNNNADKAFNAGVPQQNQGFQKIGQIIEVGNQNIEAQLDAELDAIAREWDNNPILIQAAINNTILAERTAQEKARRKQAAINNAILAEKTAQEEARRKQAAINKDTQHEAPQNISHANIHPAPHNQRIEFRTSESPKRIKLDENNASASDAESAYNRIAQIRATLERSHPNANPALRPNIEQALNTVIAAREHIRHPSPQKKKSPGNFKKETDPTASFRRNRYLLTEFTKQNTPVPQSVIQEALRTHDDLIQKSVSISGSNSTQHTQGSAKKQTSVLTNNRQITEFFQRTPQNTISNCNNQDKPRIAPRVLYNSNTNRQVSNNNNQEVSNCNNQDNPRAQILFADLNANNNNNNNQQNLTSRQLFISSTSQFSSQPNNNNNNNNNNNDNDDDDDND
jgi:hypothetical protein